MALVKFLKNGSGSLLEEQSSSDSLSLQSLTLTESTLAALNLSSTALISNLNAEFLNGKASGDFVLRDGSQSMTSDLNLDNHNIINLADPVNAQDAVTKAYADSIAAGLDPKESVRVATTSSDGNIDLSGSSPTTVIDGVTLADGDRVLIKDQTDSKENGIYIYSSSDNSYTRSSDMDGTPANEVSGGNYTFVEQGTENAGAGFVVLSDGILTIGTDNIIWSQFSGAGQITAGIALDKIGNVIDVKYDDSTVGVNGSNQLYVKTGGITTNELGDNSVTATKLNSDVAGDGLSLNGTSNAIDVNVDNSSIEINSDTLQIKDSGVTESKINNGAVTTTKIANDAVDNTKIDFGSSTNQVNATDVPTGDTWSGSATDVDAALEELRSGVGASSSFAFKTISVNGQSDVVADLADDTLTLNHDSTISIITDSNADTIGFSVANDSISLNHLAQNIDASTKGFNADKVDGKDASDLLLLDGTQSMQGDLDMGGNSIVNVGNTSISFADGSKITSSKFDTNGNVDAHSIEGKVLHTSTDLKPDPNEIFNAYQVSKRIDKFARIYHAEALLQSADDTALADDLQTYENEGNQVALDDTYNGTTYQIGDILEYRNGSWEKVNNVANKSVISILPDGVYIGTGGDIEKLNSINTMNGDNITLSNSFNMFNSDYLDDATTGGALNEVAEKNIFNSDTAEIIPEAHAVVLTASGFVAASKTYSDNKYEVVGVSLTGTGSNNSNISTNGLVSFSGTPFSGMNQGDNLYVGDNGELVNVAPTASGDVKILVGQVVNDNTMILNIQRGILIS